MSNTTSPYRFVGVYSLILDHDELTQFGQQTMLHPEQAETVLRGGAMILPDADFARFFPPDEVKARTFPRFAGQWLSAPAEMQARKKAAVTLAVERHYEALARAESPSPPVVVALVEKPEIQKEVI